MTSIDEKVSKVIEDTAHEVSNELIDTIAEYERLKKIGAIVPKGFDSDLMYRLTTGRQHLQKSIAAQTNILGKSF